MLGWLKDKFTSGSAPETGGGALKEYQELRAEQLKADLRWIYGSYDAAQDTPENIEHWANADALSADQANSPSVRRTLRNRARYEVANNTYARGIVDTLAHYCVGTGPNLQVNSGDREVDRTVERFWQEWARKISLAEKLRTMRKARATDGEAFGVMFSNENLDFPVKLDLCLVEADQVASPELEKDNDSIDGIELDEYGNPVRYQILEEHPGGGDIFGTLDNGSEPYRAERVIHWFKADRPGQHRGIPELTPALPLFAMLRRYTLAVIRSAETAASLSGVLHTDNPPGEPQEVQQFTTLDLPRGTMMSLPGGWEMTQMQAQQPSTTYPGFKKEILNEIARCLNMPFNIAACNSQDYNYASGRLDHQTFFRSVRVDQNFMARTVLDRILDAWAAEAGVLDEVPSELGEEMPHRWHWEGREHVDPSKEAKAQSKRLENDTTTLAEEYALQGKDWEEELRQRAKEKDLKEELGLGDGGESSGTQGQADLEELRERLEEIEDALSE